MVFVSRCFFFLFYMENDKITEYNTQVLRSKISGDSAKSTNGRSPIGTSTIGVL